MKVKVENGTTEMVCLADEKIKPKVRVWECKIIVSEDNNFPDGFDRPPRAAAIKAVEDSGIPVLMCISGWGGQLTKTEENELLNEDMI